MWTSQPGCPAEWKINSTTPDCDPLLGRWDNIGHREGVID